MSAWVDAWTIFDASCAACGWYGPERDSEFDAQDDADEHNAEKHSEVKEAA